MDKIKLTIFRRLFFSLILTAMLILGIPGIIVSAKNGWGVLLGISIAFTVLGFYVMPISWIMYGTSLKYKRVYNAVNNENLYTVKELSEHLRIPEREMIDILTKMIFKEFLPGYRFDNNRLILNENKKLDRENMLSCSSCGAKYIVKGKEGICPYCGSKNEID